MTLFIGKVNPQALHQTIQTWFNISTNKGFLLSEQALLKDFSKDIFGYHLLQLQDLGHGLAPFEDCPIQQKWQINLVQAGTPNRGLYAASEFLPIASDSVDLVVLTHTLDFTLDPQQVLREVERVLIPEGRVVIMGFNPISRLGLMKYLPPWRYRAPFQGHFLAYRRLYDWLGLLGFSVEQSDVLLMPPLQNAGWIRRWFPVFADVYALRAVKRVSTIRPVKMRHWRNFRVLGPRVVEPSTRNVLDSENHATKS